jgi:penicillin G amidase
VIRLTHRRRCLTALIAGLLAALALAAPAGARIIKAESVLPPGESGYVSLGGLVNGTGSPHLYDQQSLFNAFRRLNAMLGLGGTPESAPHAGVTIVRDRYGVPAVTGKSMDDAWWGVGYVTAEDRLVQLELFRHGATGTLASVLGKSYLDADIEARRDYYTPAELTAMGKQLPAALRARYLAYLAGINAWVAHIQADPAAEPGEFPVVGLKPTPFTLNDLLAIGVFLARTTPNGDGDELTDAKALDELGASRFNTILPLRIRGQVSTIPASDGLFPSVPGRTRAQERTALRRSARFVKGLPLPSGNQPSGTPGDPGATAAQAKAPIRVGGSYAIAVRDRRHHRAFLFSGPELGFQAPSQLYEVEVRAPGLDARGVTIPGAPIVGIGHNAHVAWGLTSGLSQTNSLYAEKLTHPGSDSYRFRGHVLAMSCRTEHFTYKDKTTSQQVPVSEKLCRTVHGPVQARAGGIAYARRYATWKRELGTIVGLAAVDQARNIADLNRAAAELTWNENMIAADDHGNIGYWHPGLMPLRPVGWDERLPYPGTGQAEWRGFLSLSQRPHVINPQQGWLTNWNTLPSQGWTTGNDTASERVAGRWFRDAFLERVVVQKMVRHAPTFAGLQAVIHAAGTTAQQRPLATADLKAALHGAKGHARTVLAAILAWKGSYDRTDAHGDVSPGVAAWQAFKVAAQGIALKRLGPGAELIGGGGPNSEHIFDVSLGQAYALRTLGPAGWRAAAAAAYAALVGQFHSGAPASWAAPRTTIDISALGAEQPGSMPFFDRGSWEQLVELGR